VSLPFDEIMSFRESGCHMIGDYRHYPIAIMHVIGQPGESSMDFLFVTWRGKITQHAFEEKKGVAVIVNLSQMIPPTATVRKRAGERAANDRATPGLVSTNLIVTSALLRGILTAVSWVAGNENAPTTHARSMEDAIANSLQALEKAGIKGPALEPTGYVMPPVT
jgi:hypothetical protein